MEDAGFEVALVDEPTAATPNPLTNRMAFRLDAKDKKGESRTSSATRLDGLAAPHPRHPGEPPRPQRALLPLGAPRVHPRGGPRDGRRLQTCLENVTFMMFTRHRVPT